MNKIKLPETLSLWLGSKLFASPSSDKDLTT